MPTQEKQVLEVAEVLVGAARALAVAVKVLVASRLVNHIPVAPHLPSQASAVNPIHLDLSSKPAISGSGGKSYSSGSSSSGSSKPIVSGNSGKSYSSGSSSSGSSKPIVSGSGGESYSSGSSSSQKPIVSGSSSSQKPAASTFNKNMSDQAKRDESKAKYQAATKPAPDSESLLLRLLLAKSPLLQILHMSALSEIT
jgi:hypothetical protein